jgi:hypothetical protein
MTQPEVSNTTQVAYDSLMPWNSADEVTGWHLLKFIAAVTADLSAMDDLVRDTDDNPGWSIVLDADNAPVEYLPWIGQFIGADVDLNLSEADQREQVKHVAGFRRGTLASMIAAARPYLTGTKKIVGAERSGNAYNLLLRTFASETTDPTKVYNALLSQKPAGITLDYGVITGIGYATITVTAKTYDELRAEFPTYDDMTHATSV